MSLRLEDLGSYGITMLQVEAADFVAVRTDGIKVAILKSKYTPTGSCGFLWFKHTFGFTNPNGIYLDVHAAPATLHIGAAVIAATTSGAQPVNVTKHKTEGYYCGGCRNYVPMSEPNQPDGSFRCYSCRSPS